MVKSNLAYKAQDTVVPEVVVNESPIKWCAVALSDVIARGKRLEASVFDVEAKQARSLIAKGKYTQSFIGGASGMASSYVCGRFKRIWVEKSDMPIYQPSSIVDIKPTPDGYISAKTKTNIGNLRVKENQILMTCSGTIGKVSFVSRTLANKIFSHDLLRIDCRKPDEAGYIYAFLKSKIGNKILLTNSYGAVITHIEPEHLATVPIPDAPTMLKKKIHDLIVRSYELRDESNDLIDQATALLIGELKLPDIDAFDVGLYKKAAPVDTFSVRLSEMSGRLDASYHVPIVDAIIEHLKRYAEEVTTVGDPRISREVILPGRFKRVYVDEGYGRVLIGGKQLSELDPSSKKYLSTAKHDKMLKKLEVHEGTTLITRSGTIGKITIVPKHWEHYIPSDHIIRVIPANKDIAGYYKCVSVKKKRTECHKKPVRKEWIEDLVVGETMKMVMDDKAIEAIVSMLMDLQDRDNVNVPLYEQQIREADTAISNLLNAIQQGILTRSTKERLEELENRRDELENRLACEKLAKPKVSAEFMTFWLHRFRKLDVRQQSHRKMLIDTFINAIFLYDDKMVITFNYKEGTKTITFAELQEAISNNNGSDLDCIAAP